MAVVELNKQAKKVKPFAQYMGEALADFVEEAALTGSRAICSPPPMDTDIDILCYVQEAHLDEFCDTAKEEGWKNAPYPDVVVDSWKHPDSNINLLVTCYSNTYNRWMNATVLAKKLNLLKKEDRIALFNVVANQKYENFFQPVAKKAEPLLAQWVQELQNEAIHQAPVPQMPDPFWMGNVNVANKPAGAIAGHYEVDKNALNQQAAQAAVAMPAPKPKKHYL